MTDSAPPNGSRKKGAILDRLSRFSEILFGLIMALGVTGSLGAATGRSVGVKTILWSAVGCNLAWGVVDAVMFVLSQVADRGHELRELRRVQMASPEEGRRLLAAAVPDFLANGVDPGHPEARAGAPAPRRASRVRIPHRHHPPRSGRRAGGLLPRRRLHTAGRGPLPDRVSNDPRTAHLAGDRRCPAVLGRLRLGARRVLQALGAGDRDGNARVRNGRDYGRAGRVRPAASMRQWRRHRRLCLRLTIY